MWLRRSLLVASLAALVSLGLVNPASAVVDPDPDPGPEVTAQYFPYGVIDLSPGAGFCFDPIPASQVQYRVGVFPNLGSPKAKIVVWRWTDPSGADAVKVLSVKVTGPNAVDRTFFGPAVFQICASYPIGQAVSPGNP